MRAKYLRALHTWTTLISNVSTKNVRHKNLPLSLVTVFYYCLTVIRGRPLITRGSKGKGAGIRIFL